MTPIILLKITLSKYLYEHAMFVFFLFIVYLAHEYVFTLFFLNPLIPLNYLTAIEPPTPTWPLQHNSLQRPLTLDLSSTFASGVTSGPQQIEDHFLCCKRLSSENVRLPMNSTCAHDVRLYMYLWRFMCAGMLHSITFMGSFNMPDRLFHSPTSAM